MSTKHLSAHTTKQYIYRERERASLLQVELNSTDFCLLVVEFKSNDCKSLTCINNTTNNAYIIIYNIDLVHILLYI